MTLDMEPSRDESRRLIWRFHNLCGDVDDCVIDATIGLCRSSAESGLNLSKLILQFGNHRMELGDLSYRIIRDLYRALDATPDDVILDLGSGYGRIALYGGLLLNQPIIGMEIIPERVREALRVRDALGLSTVRFLQGNVVTSPWPAASIYLVLNSVFPPFMPALIDRLYDLSKSRRLLIASLSTSNGPLRAQSWLRERIPDCASANLPVGLRLYDSVPDHSSLTGTATV
jgi:hypothetical protein